MEVKKSFPCEECHGRGGMTVGVMPDPVTLRRPTDGPDAEPVFETKWEPCAKCDGTGAVARWVWVGP